VRALVADRADHRALDTSHDMRPVAELPDFLHDGVLFFFGDVWFENDNHKKQKAAGDAPAARLLFSSTQPQSQVGGSAK
jgi:hypothetical protein